MRHEFPNKIKKAAKERSGGVCEASGTIYGLEPGERCNLVLSIVGVQYDHWPLPAQADDSATLENCMAVCPICHQYKTRHWDIPAEAKIKRLMRKNGPVEFRRKTKPIPKSPRPLLSRPFPKRKAST